MARFRPIYRTQVLLRRGVRTQTARFPQHTHLIPAPIITSCPTPPPSFPRRRESGHARMPTITSHPATHPRHSRVGGNLDARYCGVSRAARVSVHPTGWGHRPRAHVRVLTASLSMRASLRRLPGGAGAEEGGACGDEQAAGEEEQQQQAAGDAGAASSGELVRRNGRRGGRCHRRGHGRASWGHGWRRCGRGRPGCHDVI